MQLLVVVRCAHDSATDEIKAGGCVHGLLVAGVDLWEGFMGCCNMTRSVALFCDNVGVSGHAEQSKCLRKSLPLALSCNVLRAIMSMKRPPFYVVNERSSRRTDNERQKRLKNF